MSLASLFHYLMLNMFRILIQVNTSVKGCVPATLPVLGRPYDVTVCALQALICCKATGEE